MSEFQGALLMTVAPYLGLAIGGLAALGLIALYERWERRALPRHAEQSRAHRWLGCWPFWRGDRYWRTCSRCGREQYFAFYTMGPWRDAPEHYLRAQRVPKSAEPF